MSRVIGTASPIYWPTIQTPFPSGITHKQAACSCFDDQFEQKFHCTDTLTFFVKVGSSVFTPRVYVLDEEGNRISSFIGGTNVAGTFDSYYFNISLNNYCDSKISIEYTENSFITGEASIGNSNYFYVTSSYDCVECAREIKYSGECIEFDTNYGPTTAPSFEYTLRLDGALDIVSEESQGEYYKDSRGVYSGCGIETDEVWRFNISYIPSWMRRKLIYIFKSKNFSIDGWEMIPNSTLNQGQTSGFLSEADILLKPKNAFTTITGCC